MYWVEILAYLTKFLNSFTFWRFSTDDKTSNEFFFYIKLYTLSCRSVTSSVIIQRTLNDWIIQYEYVPWLTHHSNPPSKGQSKTKYEPAIKMCKETASNGGLSKENRCMYASQVNYGKPLDCKKIVKRKFNESFQKLNC